MNSNRPVNESSLYRIHDRIKHVKPSSDPPKDYSATDPDWIDYTPQIYEETLRQRLEEQNSATLKSSECTNSSATNLTSEEDFAIYKAMKVNLLCFFFYIPNNSSAVSKLFRSVRP